MKLFVTGGAGFIGSNFIRHMLFKYSDISIVNYDLLTYAGNLENLTDIEKDVRYSFIKGDISERKELESVLADGKFDAIVNFAAESHVDRSIHFGAEAFIKTNVLGTQVLIDCARKSNVERFVHVSTDEVYGNVEGGGYFTEETPLQPNNPYSATKAASDMLVKAAVNTYKLDAVITRCSNNFGHYQFPEKLIPLMITNAIEDKPLPIYGDGMQIRDWIYVLDHCAGIDMALRKGRAGQIYNFGGTKDIPNIEIVRHILRLLNKPESLITYVADRPGHDRRYAIDSSKAFKELGWQPAYSFELALKGTVEWYLGNREWWSRVKSGEYLNYYEKMYLKR
jgi:dTDP-glucose 4,6-dehydratase